MRSFTAPSRSRYQFDGLGFELGPLEHCDELLGKALQVAGIVDASVACPPLGNEHIASKNAVFEAKRRGAKLREGHFDSEQVVEARGTSVLGVGLYDGEVQAPIGPFAVAKAAPT